MSRRARFILLSIVLILPFSAQYADSDGERQALAQIVSELQALNSLIDRAEREANPGERIRFRYDWLRRDLKLVERGIEDHLDSPGTEPRRFPPLQGDYRR